MEAGSKKHILAERYLETGVAESLSNLFVCNYSNFKSLSSLLKFYISISSSSLSYMEFFVCFSN